MSRQLKRQIGKAQGGRGVKVPPARRARPRSREERLNRILLIGGGGLAIGAVLLAILTNPFNPTALAINLAAIVVGLLMGKGIGMFMFRRVLPTVDK